MTLPKEPFVIKYWRDWENIEKKAKEKEEMQEQMQQTQGPDVETDQQDNEPKKNQVIFNELLNCIRDNMSYAMTDVSSSWIDKIGYDDETDFLYAIFTGVSYRKPAPMGEWSFIDWEDAGSKGRYF